MADIKQLNDLFNQISAAHNKVVKEHASLKEELRLYKIDIANNYLSKLATDQHISDEVAAKLVLLEPKVKADAEAAAKAEAQAEAAKEVAAKLALLEPKVKADAEAAAKAEAAKEVAAKLAGVDVKVKADAEAAAKAEVQKQLAAKNINQQINQQITNQMAIKQVKIDELEKKLADIEKDMLAIINKLQKKGDMDKMESDVKRYKKITGYLADGATYDYVNRMLGSSPSYR